MIRAPGKTPASWSPRIPEAGSLGNVSPGGTGIASVCPRLVRDPGAIPIYRNLPSGAHATGHVLAQIRSGAPPPTGIAIEAARLTVNADCTGTLFPISPGTVEIVLVDGGKEFLGLRTDKLVFLFGASKKQFPDDHEER
jgi:hypothetical protein